jgi:hypothetical protein
MLGPFVLGTILMVLIGVQTQLLARRGHRGMLAATAALVAVIQAGGIQAAISTTPALVAWGLGCAVGVVLSTYLVKE